MPQFSVVMPLYNKQDFVADAVRSVLSQTLADFELIVVDDSSTDASVQIVTNFDDPRISIVRHPANLGLSAARNTGIEHARAVFVAFLDADDLWNDDFLQQIDKLIQHFPEAGIFATSYREDRNDGQSVPLKLNLPAIPPVQSGIIDDYFEAARFQPPYWFGSVAVRKCVFEDVGFFDPNITFGEDTDWNIRANLRHKCAFLNEPHAVYRISSQNQITASKLSGRIITDFDKYEQDNRTNQSLKKFLDANRYFLAMMYKLEGANNSLLELRKKINPINLTRTQRFMLAAPLWMVRLAKKIKNALLRKKIRVTSF